VKLPLILGKGNGFSGDSVGKRIAVPSLHVSSDCTPAFNSHPAGTESRDLVDTTGSIFFYVDPKIRIGRDLAESYCQSGRGRRLPNDASNGCTKTWISVIQTSFHREGPNIKQFARLPWNYRVHSPLRINASVASQVRFNKETGRKWVV
jgi:hypothetical protein